jgi:hypothetical protein
MAPVPNRRSKNFRRAAPIAAVFAALAMAAVGASAETSQPHAQVTPPSSSPPVKTAPGAAPSASRLVGTWLVTQAEGGPADGRSDRSESTTYRFEEGGRVTVAGAKQCAYSLDEAELKVDCNGRIAAGKLEFRDAQTMIWTVGAKESITLTRR